MISKAIALVFLLVFSSLSSAESMDSLRDAVSSSNKSQLLKIIEDADGRVDIDVSLLEISIRYGYVDIFDLLVSEYSKNNNFGNIYNDLFNLAACKINIKGFYSSDVIRYLLNIKPTYSLKFDGCDVIYQLLLHVKYSPGDIVLLEQVLKRGAVSNLLVNEFGNYNYPLQMAILENKKNWVELLLKYGALEKTKLLPEEYQPISYAVSQAVDEDIIKLLLEYGADASNGEALSSAIRNRQVHILKLLLQHAANPNKKIEIFGYPLIYATSIQSQEMTQVLLEYGADKTVADDQGKTALDHAKRLNNHKLVCLLDSTAEGCFH